LENESVLSHRFIEGRENSSMVINPPPVPGWLIRMRAVDPEKATIGRMIDLKGEKNGARVFLRMAYFMIPRYLEFRDSLPKTTTEKVMKEALKREGISSQTWGRQKMNDLLKSK
jgi:acyl-CoA synthetase (AMP-forming)/AMP-acid ligase II